jgi:hypothetical protein
MSRIASIRRQKCAPGPGLAVLFSWSRNDFDTFICNEFPTQTTNLHYSPERISEHTNDWAPLRLSASRHRAINWHPELFQK